GPTVSQTLPAPEFAEYLRELIESRNVSLEEFALELGESYDFIRKWFSSEDRRVPRAKLISTAAEVLHLTPAESQYLGLVYQRAVIREALTGKRSKEKVTLDHEQIDLVTQ